MIQISERLHVNIKTVSQSLKNDGITQEAIFQRRSDAVGKRSSKKVLQYTMQGDYIAEYPSASEAARNMNKKPSQIAKACQGKYALTAYGYIWQYKDDDNVEEIVSTLKTKNKVGANKKPIQQLDENGNILAEFDSASAAGRSLNKKHAAIAKAARENKKAYGYFWRYIN